ncbi:hypothetical protein PHYBLDRAFT_188240 [Phycomyces blakesleeanus NRRL 1555(-)]|uniref:Uncharacterized protein n=1 Tax=Phycomyces blakesleeanus (strain ATCC 8743b / DSM 1359 / FGSC 10004 / NBRC 33097 / NRRL 1555) TaxID=763407 RepID=A0A167LBB0_PHYB8|nr:hypothetical protein PHYBLDRAFT_188240 [Phycomyces blakesleeanus NRRL 1555(-)]OAD70049.1 hypothetical protein PHYBLDRAFT_188240 [Phycomyces blakesleeanus NRRL 1555(-)]|eukprot:XP_018288089.1 hypothetical protein PHYBLDRAFT_188240 [Phycomyces blakesleeanus NRRL 1555(-)]
MFRESCSLLSYEETWSSDTCLDSSSTEWSKIVVYLEFIPKTKVLIFSIKHDLIYSKKLVYLRTFMESETLIAGLCRKKYGNIQLKENIGILIVGLYYENTRKIHLIVKTVTVDMSCEDSGHIKQAMYACSPGWKSEA